MPGQQYKVVDTFNGHEDEPTSKAEAKAQLDQERREWRSYQGLFRKAVVRAELKWRFNHQTNQYEWADW